MDNHGELVRHLEGRFRALSLLLYDTSADPARVDAEVAPLLDEHIRFTDPWQQAAGRDKYRLGAAGFHAMLSFHFDIEQVGIQLEHGAGGGRAIVDGVMHLHPFGPRWSYPLRTILVYEFVLTGRGAAGPTFLVRTHEEMWSIADMLAAVPLAGRIYTRLFRPAFSVGFLAASWLTGRKRLSKATAH